MNKNTSSFDERSIALHASLKGKISVESKVSVTTKDELALVYSPGVAAPCLVIAENPERVNDFTMRGNMIAVVSDGSAVLGLGNIGPRASLPVMEGKAMLFKQFADIDAFPLVLNTQDVDEIVQIVRALEPTFGGINLEDISSPRCIEIEERLQDLGIPVFHDDQWGTAIVVLAGLLNASRVVKKSLEDMNIVINGAGAAGLAIAKILSQYVSPVVVDSKGIISQLRNDLNSEKKKILSHTNKKDISGSLQDALVDADVFIGVSVAQLLTREDIQTMAQDSIVFALANPIPEIMPDEAKAGGARVVATGRSDFPNQVNNVLVFPGLFRGALDAHVPTITMDMKLACARALAFTIETPTEDVILPDPFDPRIVKVIAQAIKDSHSQHQSSK